MTTGRPVARLDFGGCGTPESGPFGPNPPHETSFLAHFMTKSGPFGPNPPQKPHFSPFCSKKWTFWQIWGEGAPSHPPGYGPDNRSSSRAKKKR